MFILYKSSAGSGKTFTLVKEYLKLCLNRPQNYAAILAITFTNKAAAEMKTRIISSLHNYLKSGDDAIVNLVADELNMTAGKATENGRMLMDLILHSYSDFGVMTIDSFIGRIVRAFAYDLDMPLKYDVELDTAHMTDEIVERLFADVRSDNFTGRALTEFALSKIHSTGSWSVENELKKIGHLAFNEKHGDSIEILLQPQFNDRFWDALIAAIRASHHDFQNHVNGLARRGLEIIARHGLAVDDFMYKKAGAAGTLVKYATATGPDDFSLNKRFENGMWIAASASDALTQKIQSALDDGLEQVAIDIVDYIKQHWQRYVSTALVYKSIYSEALIHQFLRYCDLFKKENLIVPLFDFGQKVAAVVKHEPIPFLYWRLGTQYRHIMIDEFQDTSRQQWINLKPLIEETLSNGHMNLAVGDGKQAIYRFRAGDVDILENQLSDVLGDYVVSKQLKRNYRSRKEIVAFNNAFFRALPGAIAETESVLVSTLYSEDNVRQKPVSDLTGYVQIRRVAMGDAKRKVDRRRLILEHLHDDIKQILNEANGYGLHDMTILVRNNAEAELIAQTLFDNGIDVISPNSLLLKNAPVVRFVVCALRVLVEDDRIALCNLWLFLGKDIREFEKKINEPAGYADVLQSLSSAFFRHRPYLVQLPVYEALEEIIRIFMLNRHYCGYLQGLLEVVLNDTAKFGGGIQRFLGRWDDQKDATLASVERSNAVTISTIHKAKGLEYPIVLIPFGWEITENAGAGKSNFIWGCHPGFGEGLERFPFLIEMKKALEDSWFRDLYLEEQAMSRIDNLNLLYVAFTRARDRLYLYLESGKEKDPVKNTQDLICKITAAMSMHESGNRLMLGAPDKNHALPEASDTEIHAFASYAWRRKITMKKNAMNLGASETEGLRERMRQGVLMHEILAAIETVDDIDRAIESKQRLGMIGSAQKSEFRVKIDALMRRSVPGGTVADWFQHGLNVKNERTMVWDDGECRPDRVILFDDKAIVIDYKTGRQSPDHQAQIETYARHLQNMGIPRVEKYLLYLDMHDVVEA